MMPFRPFQHRRLPVSIFSRVELTIVQDGGKGRLEKSRSGRGIDHPAPPESIFGREALSEVMIWLRTGKVRQLFFFLLPFRDSITRRNIKKPTPPPKIQKIGSHFPISLPS
jgi:hypothetical protein